MLTLIAILTVIALAATFTGLVLKRRMVASGRLIMRLTGQTSPGARPSQSPTLRAACGSSSHASPHSNCATRAGFTDFAVDAGSSQAQGHPVSVQERDFDFHPTCLLDVPAGTMALTVHNVGSQVHNVSIAAQHIDRDVQPWATVDVPVKVGPTPIGAATAEVNDVLRCEIRSVTRHAS